MTLPIGTTALLALLLGYAIGSIPFGLLLVRAAGKGDVRSVGSGNIGATNVLRAAGKGIAAATLVLDAGVSYSVLAVGELDNIEPLVITEADRRRVATEARVRIVHGSPTAGAVDIYVTAQDADISTLSPAFSNVPFRAETGLVALAPGDYDITVTPAGSKSAAIGPVSVSLEGGGLYGAVARDNEGGGVPLGLILLDDFNID